jgi:4'-phosphopantetheinyl transferase EntD
MSALETPWGDRVLVLGTPHPPSDALATRMASDSFSPRRGEKVPKADEGSWFTATELAIANAFKLAKRREEWLHGRMAAKQLAMNLGLASDPRTIAIERPFLSIDGKRSEWRVSLSHSEPYAGAAIAREPIGLDVQVVRELDERAAHLFLSPREIEQMQRCPLPHRILHFWCAKEAEWKRRSDEFVTLRQVPLELLDERADALTFDAVETLALRDAIVAVTRPTS